MFTDDSFLVVKAVLQGGKGRNRVIFSHYYGSIFVDEVKQFRENSYLCPRQICPKNVFKV